MKASSIIANIERAKAEGDDMKAHMLANRLAAMKTHDAVRGKGNKEYKPLIIA